MIKKLFIKNYEDTINESVRNNYLLVSSIFGIIINILLGVLKLIIGLFTNSISIIIDAFNNITDTFSSILTKLSINKNKYEYISAYTISLFMTIMGFMFLKESIIKIINPFVLNINIGTYIILIMSILLKLYQMKLYDDFYKSINSRILYTLMIETKNDVITTSSILLSIIISSLFSINIDGYLGVVVSIFIIFNSIKSLKINIKSLI